MKSILFFLVVVLLPGCVRRPTRVELMAENEKVRAENKELRQGILDMAKKYKALRGPYMNPDSPVRKDK